MVFLHTVSLMIADIIGEEAAAGSPRNRTTVKDGAVALFVDCEGDAHVCVTILLPFHVPLNVLPLLLLISDIGDHASIYH